MKYYNRLTSVSLDMNAFRTIERPGLSDTNVPQGTNYMLKYLRGLVNLSLNGRLVCCQQSRSSASTAVRCAAVSSCSHRLEDTSMRAFRRHC